MRWGLAALVALAACKSGPPCSIVESAMDEGADRKHVLRDQKAVLAGKTVCPAYFPVTHVSVLKDDVAVAGTRGPIFVAKRKSLSAANVQRSDELFAQLKGVRQFWYQIHPGQEFPGRVAIDVDPALESARGGSVVGTAAYAGYPNVEVQAGAA